jgi:ABC-2 type transport system ATP-binding protein
MKPVISVQHLRKTYGKFTAVEDISFDIEEGEIFGFLGPNGAGKTTTVECLQALRRPDSGQISIIGLDGIHNARAVKQLIGSQLQESALPDRIKVWEALELFDSVSANAADWRLLLDQWGLAEKRKASFGSLSGGQRQRLFIALALVNNPKVVFLDEMTTGLDPAARRVAWGLIKSVREKGTTVVLVTHFMDEAETLCDRVAVVNRGRIIASDTPRGLINRHVGEVRVLFTAESGDMPWLKSIPGVTSVSVSGKKVEIAGSGSVLALTAIELGKHGIIPADLRVEQPTLEDVFLKLTGKSAEE